MRSHFSPHHYQANLDDELLDLNKEFARKIGTLGLGVDYRFDYLDCSRSWARQRDNDMTLDHYLDLMQEPWALVQLNSYPEAEIRFVIAHVFEPKDRKAERFLFYECPYSEERLLKVEGLFEEVYGKSLWTAQAKNRFMESLRAAEERAAS